MCTSWRVPGCHCIRQSRDDGRGWQAGCQAGRRSDIRQEGWLTGAQQPGRQTASRRTLRHVAARAWLSRCMHCLGRRRGNTSGFPAPRPRTRPSPHTATRTWPHTATRTRPLGGKQNTPTCVPAGVHTRMETATQMYSAVYSRSSAHGALLHPAKRKEQAPVRTGRGWHRGSHRISLDELCYAVADPLESPYDSISQQDYCVHCCHSRYNCSHYRRRKLP